MAPSTRPVARAPPATVQGFSRTYAWVVTEARRAIARGLPFDLGKARLGGVERGSGALAQHPDRFVLVLREGFQERFDLGGDFAQLVRQHRGLLGSSFHHDGYPARTSNIP